MRLDRIVCKKKRYTSLCFMQQSLTWHDLEYTIDMVGKYKLVFIIKTVGYLERWKYVKYAKAHKGRLKIKYGWILGTTVENTEKFSIKKS